MRLPLALAMLAVSLPAGSLAAEMQGTVEDGENMSVPTARSAPLSANKECRSTAAHSARSPSIWRGQPTVPRNLDELPPATAYMAVYRTVDGCEVPMTVVEYRTGSGR